MIGRVETNRTRSVYRDDRTSESDGVEFDRSVSRIFQRSNLVERIEISVT